MSDSLSGVTGAFTPIDVLTMKSDLIYFVTLFVSCVSFSIEPVSDKVSATVDDNFPNWVPFKNKHGDELGDFVPVTRKSKIKKRLAPPISFLLRAVADPESDDYFEKGLGESDSDDYFEKKEWSDLYRAAQPANGTKITQTDITNIDGVDNSVKKSDNPIVVEINKVNEEKMEAPEENKTLQRFATDTDILTEEGGFQHKSASKRDKIRKNNDDDEDDDDEILTKKTINRQDLDNEVRKAKILSSVDDLKERHAEEQKRIFERDRDEEDLFYKLKTTTSERPTRYNGMRKQKKIAPPDYDEYEDKNIALGDKYKINPIMTIKNDDEDSMKVLVGTSTTTEKVVTHKYMESGKLSVFRNPHLYMIYDDNEETTMHPGRQGKISSRYTTNINGDLFDERISLVPEESKEGEPTMFFPKKKKNRRRKTKTTSSTAVATTPSDEDVSVNPATLISLDTTAADSQIKTVVPEGFVDSLGNDEEIVTIENGGTGGTTNTGQTATEGTDVTPDASEMRHTAEIKEFRDEKGGGKEHDSEYEEENEEHEKKSYKKKMLQNGRHRPTVVLNTDYDGITSQATILHPISRLARGEEFPVLSPRPDLDPSDGINLDQTPRQSRRAKHRKPSNATLEADFYGAESEGVGEADRRQPKVYIADTTVHSPRPDLDPLQGISLEKTPRQSRRAKHRKPSNATLEADFYGAESEGVGEADQHQPKVYTDDITVNSPRPELDKSQGKVPKKTPRQSRRAKHRKPSNATLEADFYGAESEGVGEADQHQPKAKHDDKKTSEGHHNKEDHLGKYVDHGGFNKRHNEESDHFGKHQHEEQGKKHAKYEESGKHSKGHSTKGSHDIHKKEEYEKNVEFFEEDGDSAEEEKHGGFNHENEHKKGASFKNGKLRGGHLEHNHGESSLYNKGRFFNDKKGHNSAQGHDIHGKNGKQKVQRDERQAAKKWVYHHGYPAKNANLVIIDRRGDKFYHGPQYYG